MKRALTGLLAALPLLLAPVAAGAHKNEGTGAPWGANAAVVGHHGDNQGGDNQGGDNQGGDNQGGDNQGGDNQGGDNNQGGDDQGEDQGEDQGYIDPLGPPPYSDPLGPPHHGKPAPKHRSLYAFVGTVSATDTTNGTVTVTVTRTLPASLAPAGSSATFTVGSDTLVLGAGSGSSLFGGSLSDVQPGDVVAGGLMSDRGLTLAQVSPQPLRLLLDLPAGTSLLPHHASHAKVARVKSSILHRALSILDGTTKVKVVKKGSSHKHASHKHAGSHHSHKSSGHAKAHTHHSRARHH